MAAARHFSTLFLIDWARPGDSKKDFKTPDEAYAAGIKRGIELVNKFRKPETASRSDKTIQRLLKLEATDRGPALSGFLDQREASLNSSLILIGSEEVLWPESGG
jgi:hypothetical protein